MIALEEITLSQRAAWGLWIALSTAGWALIIWAIW